MSYGMNSPRGNTSTGANIGPTATGSMKERIPSGFKKSVVQNYTPEAMGLYQQMFQHVSPDSYLSRLAGGDESLFNEIEAPAMRQFSQLQGNLASRFSGMGMGGRHSSGFQNTANQAASNFAQDLQSRRQGLMQQAIKDLMGLSHTLMNEQPYDVDLVEKKEKKKGFNWGGLGGAAIGGVGGFFAGGGNPLTAIQGAGAGYNIGSKFSGY